MSLDINRMSIENHLIICGKRGKNPSQPINPPFTAPVSYKCVLKLVESLGGSVDVRQMWIKGTNWPSVDGWGEIRPLGIIVDEALRRHDRGEPAVTYKWNRLSLRNNRIKFKNAGWKITDHSRGIYRRIYYPDLIEGKPTGGCRCVTGWTCKP
jgi:hypothetical protein